MESEANRPGWHGHSPSITQGLRKAGFRKEFDRSEPVHSKAPLLAGVGEVVRFKVGGMQVGVAITHALQRSLRHEL